MAPPVFTANKPIAVLQSHRTRPPCALSRSVVVRFTPCRNRCYDLDFCASDRTSSDMATLSPPMSL
jgi:hypothetical protein